MRWFTSARYAATLIGWFTAAQSIFQPQFYELLDPILILTEKPGIDHACE